MARSRVLRPPLLVEELAPRDTFVTSRARSDELSALAAVVDGDVPDATLFDEDTDEWAVSVPDDDGTDEADPPV